jgi:hypothetical protein
MPDVAPCPAMPELATDPLRLNAMPWKAGAPGTPCDVEFAALYPNFRSFVVVVPKRPCTLATKLVGFEVTLNRRPVTPCGSLFSPASRKKR